MSNASVRSKLWRRAMSKFDNKAKLEAEHVKSSNGTETRAKVRKKEALALGQGFPPSLRFPSVFARNRRTGKITTRANLRRFSRHKTINLPCYRKVTIR